MLTLFGEPRFSGVPIPLERVTYLLAILACRAEWVSRDELVLLLWGDTDENAGRQRLRQLLYRARGFPHAAGLEADATRVRLNAQSDVHAFREAIRAQRLSDAIALYGGELLQNVTLPDLSELEEFFAYTREEFIGAYRQAVLTRIGQLEPSEALPLLDRATELDPMSEELLRELLRLSTKGEPETAKRAFERHRRALKTLDLEPNQELLGLLARLDEGATSSAPVWLPKRSAAKLPVPTTAFIGRQTELQSIHDRLSDPACRLVTILGPGGAGKTRLSLETAAQWQSQFRDGSVFVGLAPVASVDLVPDAVLETLATAKGNDARTSMLDHLSGRELLLVLDNLEHLPGMSTLVADILERAPTVRVLVTSREALLLRAENVIELQGMPAPDTLFPLETQDAALLFMRAAQRVRPDFRFQKDLEAFSRIYRAVSGMPLGLELAASWVRVMTLPEIADELERSLDFLEVDAVDMPSRHRSFAAAFRSSWALLSDAERGALARMSVFRGGFTREMAQEVAQSNLPVLLRLVNKSLVTRRETRFFLHEMIRQYAERELPVTDREKALKALGRVCLEVADEWYRHLGDGRQVELSRRLEQDHDNVRNALDWTLHNDVRVGAGIAGQLEHFWYTRGYHREGVQWAGRFLERPEVAPRDKLRLQLLWTVVSLSKELSEYDRSHEALREYEAIAHELEDQNAIAASLKFTGLLIREGGNLETARDYLERAKTMYEELGNRNQTGICWNDIGITYGNADDFERAKICFEKSLEIKREIGDKMGIAYALANLGMIVGSLGDTELAKVLQEESLRMKRELGDAQGTANGLHSLGFLALNAKDYGLARAYFQESLDIFLRLGRRWAIAHLVLDFARLEHTLGHFDRALRLSSAAEEGMRRIGSKFGKNSLDNIAHYRRDHPFNEAQRVKLELEGERMSLEEAAMYALSAEATLEEVAIQPGEAIPAAG